ncbi:cobalt-precorrin-6A reductase [Acetobacteraceae bacterium KSS8]|uniref:Cobalt-precorrin-6A reductase n=1 Tax=Endosaccharibacter trunci TaxID=2812733 RepID=A0ABT1W2J6_9PROT|nr:cobalt-precorrin-6A reductase [Acetobacteraceae bacterium KSS8]
MPSPIPILILGGTAEARALAASLRDDGRFAPLLSLAGATEHPVEQPVPTRSGGFGGAEGLASFLRDNGIRAVVDATHPFATRISANAARACLAAAVELVRIERPAWSLAGHERWTEVEDMEAAAAYLGRRPLRVFLTVGRRDLEPFKHQKQHFFLVRSVEAPPAALLPPRCRVVTARGPFTVEEERALMLRHRIQVLVCKNSGGASVAAKLDVAEQERFPVILVKRPPAAESRAVPGWREALEWLEALHHSAEMLRAV